MKIAINNCYGGFSLSPAAILELYNRGYRDNLENAKKYFGGRDYSESLENFKAWEKDPKVRLHLMTPVFVDNYTKVASNIRDDASRTHPLVIQVIKDMGKKANGLCADIKIIDIPDDIEYQIEEYDGMETVAEKHRTWD